MDAQDSGGNNPFDNALCSLEWIACAMDAARRHNERKSNPEQTVEPDQEPAPAGDSA